MSDELEGMGSYRLRATMRPMSGAPVNWNARAIIWSGADHRYHLRRLVWWLRRSPLLRSTTSRSRRYRVGLWLFHLVDDRQRHYSPRVLILRRLLNTTADVEARQAWIQTNRYWRARSRSHRVTSPTDEQGAQE